jgi:hypothetical protein
MSVAALCFAIVACKESRVDRAPRVEPTEDDFFAALETAKSMELISVHGGNFEWPRFLPPPEFPPTTDERIGGFKTFGKTEVADAETRKQLIREFREARLDPDVDLAFCFYPRHALRVSHARDGYIVILFCFQCDKFRAYYKGIVIEERMGHKPRDLMNRLLTEAGVPLCPGAEWPIKLPEAESGNSEVLPHDETSENTPL